ncbi:MAG: glycoside hydrolase family 28 protein [Marinilabiliaceae bacterium]|nr:glycoside hydrolase family 28 protein [Marinilabiliaceae bacterium]
MQMRKLIIRFLFIIPFFITSCVRNNTLLTTEIVQVNAPFEMPAITIPDFSGCKKISILDFGAEQGNKEKTSSAIKAAITKANEIGGATVVVPKGVWLTGKVHLKSNVNLYLSKGAILLFSDDTADYLPSVHTTWEGMECYNYSPLIYAYKCKNVAITGKGIVKAKMDLWTTWFSRPSAHMNSLKHLYTMASTDVPVKQRQMVNDTAHLRPHFIQFNRCENVLLDSISVRNSPFWTIHPYMCRNVVIRNLNVYAHGHNNDGVDPEMTQNMLVENCVFDQGDDAIAVKSGRNQDAWRLNTPTRNLVIRNCRVKNGHQLLAVGSELSGGIENVFMDSCRVDDGASMYHLVFIKTNERRGGYVKNIHVTNIESDKMREGVLGIETDVLYQWRNLVPTYEKRLTPISDIFLKNIKARDVKFISRILAQKEMPVENVQLINVLSDSIYMQPVINENVNGFDMKN